MTLVLPYPNTPLNGQSGDATPINANFTAITQAVQAFDGSQIVASSVVSAALSAAINPVTRDNLIIRNFVSSGCIWSSVSGLSGTMTSGTLFINGNMVTVNGVISNTFTASQDTYIDIDVNGNIYYQAVSNGASAPALTANSVRVAKIVTSGSAITSTVQIGTDSLGNLIYPPGSIGGANIQSYRSNRNNNGSSVVETTSRIQTGWIAGQPGVGNSTTLSITFPVPYLNVPIVTATFGGDTATVTSTLGSGGANLKQAIAEALSITVTGFSIVIVSRDGTNWAANNTVYAQWMAIGA